MGPGEHADTASSAAWTGNDLKRARLALGMTQKSLADAVGVTTSRVSRWEAGSQAIPRPDLDKLQRFLTTNGDRGTDTRGFRGRPRSGPSRPLSSPLGELSGLHNRVDLVELLSFLFGIPQEDCEFLLRLSIDDGPINIRACLETTVVSMALIARSVVVEPKKPVNVYPVYQEHAGYATSGMTPNPAAPARPARSSGGTPAELPLGVPVGLPETLLKYSYANNRLAVPAVGGPNHERAALVLISNLVYQIWRASGEEFK